MTRDGTCRCGSSRGGGGGGRRCGTVVLVVVASVMWMLLTGAREASGKVTLVDHGYEGIVVAINPYLKQDETMLRRLEKYLTDTSRTMFRATRNQLYFREFIIVVPETWKGLSYFRNALDVQLDRAQIIIDHANPAYGDAPYVKQYAECGQPGLYIHLTPSYLTDDDVIHKWGQPEKTLVHEWAHLRWGLFDEYPIDAQDAEFYRYNGAWQPTRCTADVDGSILNEFTSKQCSFDFFTGKPEKACRFFPRMKSNKAAASLMFMQYLESIVEFCDDPVTAPKPLRHNYLAPNRQNRLCSYRSAWEVMRKHEDFRKARRPLPDNTDTMPTFRYVQVQPRKRALVLDTSGSMTGSSLSVMMRAASNYILSCVETGSSLGIVQFNTNATALSPMIEINHEDDRQRLINSLPRQADGKTSIGAGLEKGLQLLQTTDAKQPGGTIILITDGKENERPFLEDFQQRIQSKGVVVHSLAYGQKAEKSIAQLSRRTGGKTFFYSGRKDSTALIDGLAATIRTESAASSNADLAVSIMTEAGTVFNASPVNGLFIVDETVGADTSITVSYSKEVNVTVTTPKNVVMDRDSHPQHFHFDQESGVIKILLPGLAEVGKWRYTIVTNDSQSNVVVNVQSKARHAHATTEGVLQVSSWLSYLPEDNTLDFDPTQKITVFSELIRGRAPVLNADVTAIVERPQSVALKIPLYDNGMGSDVIKDDGVYAAYVLAGDLLGNGRYNIKIKAKEIKSSSGGAGTRVVVGGPGRSSGALDMAGSGVKPELKTAPLGSFQRVTSAGEFRVTGFPPAAKDVPDEMAPSRITDLVLTRFDPDLGTADFRWTAVGGDMDRGAATGYVVQISSDFDTLFTLEVNETDWSDRQVEQAFTSMTPQYAGHTETLSVTVSEELQENVTLFFSLRAVDASGNSGDRSNVVSLSKARELAVPLEVVLESGRGAAFYLKLIVPPAATLVLFAGLVLAVLLSRRRGKALDSETLGGGGGGGGLGDGGMSGLSGSSSCMTGSTFSLDVQHAQQHMNYRHEGQYRPRIQEDPETWSQLAKSRESLDNL